MAKGSKKPPTAKQLAARERFAEMARARASGARRTASRATGAVRSVARRAKAPAPHVVDLITLGKVVYDISEGIPGLQGGVRAELQNGDFLKAGASFLNILSMEVTGVHPNIGNDKGIELNMATAKPAAMNFLLSWGGRKVSRYAGKGIDSAAKALKLPVRMAGGR